MSARFTRGGRKGTTARGLPTTEDIEKRLKDIAAEKFEDELGGVANKSKARSPSEEKPSRNEKDSNRYEEQLKRTQDQADRVLKTADKEEQELKKEEQFFENKQETFANKKETVAEEKPDSYPDMTATQQTQNREAIEKEAEEQRQKVLETYQTTIDKLKNQKEKRDNRVRTGPHGALAFFAGKTAIWISGIIDSALGSIPIPYVGALLGFLWNMFFWSIPCMILFDIPSIAKIFFFYILDAILGAVWDTIGVATTGIAYLADPIVDLLPELLGGRILGGLYPPNVVSKSYEAKKIHLLKRSEDKYEREKEAATKEKEQALADIDKKRRGEMTGKRASFSLKKVYMDADAQKISGFLLAMLILLVGPVGIFVPYLSFFTLSFSGSITTGKIIVLAVILVVLFLMKTMGVVNQRQLTGLIIFLMLNILFTYLLQGTAFLTQYMGNSSVIGLIIFLLVSVLYVLHMMGTISTRGITIVSILVLLLLSSFNLSGYVMSDQFTSDVQQSQTDAQVTAKNLNLLDMLLNWINKQRMMGSGDYIPGEVQRSHEFIGVQIAQINPYREQFRLGEPVKLDVDYAANAHLPIQILTVCKSGNHYAQTDHDFVDVSSSKNPRVTCEFDYLPKGSNMVEVKGIYSFQSTVDVPLKLMASSLEEVLTYQARDSGNNLDPEAYVGGSETAYTSPGPIVIGVSNEGLGNDLKAPIIVDKEDPSRYPTNLRFQINKQEQETPSELERIKKATIRTPQGILLESCDFGTQEVDPTYRIEGEEWVYEIVDGVHQWDVFTTVSCDLGFDEQYLDDLLPPLTMWSPQTITFTLDYNFETNLAAAVEVIS